MNVESKVSFKKDIMTLQLIIFLHRIVHKRAIGVLESGILHSCVYVIERLYQLNLNVIIMSESLSSQQQHVSRIVMENQSKPTHQNYFLMRCIYYQKTSITELAVNHHLKKKPLLAICCLMAPEQADEVRDRCGKSSHRLIIINLDIIHHHRSHD